MLATLDDAIAIRRAARSQNEYPTISAVDFFEAPLPVQTEMLKGVFLTCESRYAADVATSCIRDEHGCYASRRFHHQYDGPGLWTVFCLPAETA